jgi:kumamolisin
MSEANREGPKLLAKKKQRRQLTMRNRIAIVLFLVAGMLSFTIPQGKSQIRDTRNQDQIMYPQSSIERPEDVGVRAHTNHLIHMGARPAGGLGPAGGMTPAQIQAAYDLPATGGEGAIAIVDAFNYPTALNDFNVFAAEFGLPQETSTNVTASTNEVFQVVYATGTQPAGNCGWNQEEALDIEWAHAIAPSAKIYLVEAASSSFASLFSAVTVAANLAGVKEVSMSWGGSEFSGETSDDSTFVHSGVVFFAAAGDTGGVVEYPSSSPNVVGCGGTTLNTNSAGAFTSETAWSGSGGGSSRDEARPAYQNAIESIVGTHRGIPDIASDANPSTGVTVYDSTACDGFVDFFVVGGTSVSTPTLAAATNLANSSEASSNAELTKIYANLGSTHFRDITSGTAGRNTAKAGWDFITGVGTLQGLGGI